MDEVDFGRTPWEREDGSFPGDLVRSWMEVMTGPGRFFATLDPAVPLTRPLIFYLVFSIVGSAAVAMNGLAAPVEMFEQLPAGRAGVLLNFFVSPFVALLSLLVGIGLVHVGVLMFVRDARPIGTTARILCYASAPSVFAIVPWVGGLISGIWIVVLQILGVRYVHRTTGGRATAAVLLPLLLLFIAIMTLIVFLGVFLALAVGAAV